MSELSDLQRRISEARGLLEQYARYLGYNTRFGGDYRDPEWGVGHPKSLHGERLAFDLIVDYAGVYLEGEEAEKAHSLLHDFWDMLDGSGRIDNDLNHYSFTYNGMR